MKRIAYTTMGLLALLAVTASCDDGRLYADRLIIPEEGRVVKLTATLEGLDTWSDGYSIVLAGFEDGSDYTVIAKSVQAADDGTVDITMSGVAEEVTTLEVCAINRIRKRHLHRLPRRRPLAGPECRHQLPDAGRPAFHRVRGTYARPARQCRRERALHHPDHQRKC